MLPCDDIDALSSVFSTLISCFISTFGMSSAAEKIRLHVYSFGVEISTVV